jgi:hypothetical protein
MKVELKFPITVNKTVDKPGIEINEIDLVDRMKAKHAKLIPDDCFDGGSISPTKFIPLIAAMAGIDIAEAEELDFVDLVSIVGAVVAPFLSELGPAPK